MNVILILVTWHLILIQIIHSKIYNAIPDEELLSYEIDKSVTDNHYTYLDFSNMVIELIDDDMLQISGYFKVIKSMDPKLKVQIDVRSQYLDKSSWVEGPIRLLVPSMCPELVNPTRFWYNITKLWTKCPPVKGDVWPTEDHIVDMKINLPPSIPITKWKFFVLYTQGWPGFEKTKLGLGVQGEFVLKQ